MPGGPPGVPPLGAVPPQGPRPAPGAQPAPGAPAPATPASAPAPASGVRFDHRAGRTEPEAPPAHATASASAAASFSEPDEYPLQAPDPRVAEQPGAEQPGGSVGTAGAALCVACRAG
ncbi:serine/threonine-protein phosphatase, partial [Streptomyces sp. NPDC056734]